MLRLPSSGMPVPLLVYAVLVWLCVLVRYLLSGPDELHWLWATAVVQQEGKALSCPNEDD